MKKTWIVALALLVIAVPGFTATPSQDSLASKAMTEILAQPAVAGSCALQTSGVLLAATQSSQKSLCSATANCASGTVTCSSNISVTSCSAADRSCPGEQGHVTCNGVTTWCPTACECNYGGPRQKACCRCDQTGNCWDCMFCAYGYYIADGCP